MKTIIAAGLAALALAATSVAAAEPIHPVEFHYPARHAVVIRAPFAYRSGFARPGFYRAAYYVHGHRGGFHTARRHRRGWGFRVRGPVHHHTAWRGAYGGEHRPV